MSWARVMTVSGALALSPGAWFPGASLRPCSEDWICNLQDRWLALMLFVFIPMVLVRGSLVSPGLHTGCISPRVPIWICRQHSQGGRSLSNEPK